MSISPYVIPGIPGGQIKNAFKKARERIIRLVAAEFEVETGVFIMKLRTDEVVEARQVAMYLLLKRGNINQHNIAKMFFRHHTTVMHSLRTLQDRMDTEPELKKRVEKLLDKI